MPKKKESSHGRSLIKDYKRRFKITGDGYRHSCDLEEEVKTNLQSVTEQSTLQEFIDGNTLAEPTSEVKIIDPGSKDGLLTEDELAAVSSLQEQNKEFICIPRRPPWDESTSRDALNATERESFIAWRRKLADLQEIENINLTPFEKNLEIWRQLWRVIERSDVVVQILDSRNPLLFRCTDLEKYVKEVGESKVNILLLNKADFLTQSQRQSWCEYFEREGIRVVFFSALQQTERPPEPSDESSYSTPEADWSNYINSPDVLSREQLVSFFKRAGQTSDPTPTIGLVGYPNVGKSSTVNALLMCKKVSVSATPGKTKHFQTHVIDEEVILCDCPGLVFPNFVSTKAEMVVNGILPIDQLTESIQPVSLVTRLIPRHVLQETYSILIPRPPEGRDPHSPPTAEEFLNAHGYNRGYMTPRGIPDNSRSARYILKDFVNGKLLYCHAPPGVNQEEFHTFPQTRKKRIIAETSDSAEGADEEKQFLSDADRKFFSKNTIHTKGKSATRDELIAAGHKPWKKHHNRNKKEKIRNVYRNPYDL